MSRRVDISRYMPALALIEAAANEGRRAPSNDAIADALGTVSSQTGAKAVEVLEAAGLITVKRFQASRQITVVATGKTTAMPLNQTPHWRTRERRNYRSPERRSYSEIAATVVPPERRVEPCQHCGVRSDVGCRHQVRVALA